MHARHHTSRFRLKLVCALFLVLLVHCPRAQCTSASFGMQAARDLFSWARGAMQNASDESWARASIQNTNEQSAMTSEASARDDGSINEKAIHLRKATQLSPILHASFGLDHYPNYLLRWDMSSIEELEARLEQQLTIVRQQKETAKRRLELAASFDPVLAPIPLEQILDPRFLEALKPGGGIRPSRLKNILEEECDGAFSFPLFKPEFCEQLLQAAEKFQHSVQGCSSDSIRERPLVLDLMKLDWLNDALLQQVVNPLAELLMDDEVGDEGGKLDWRHGYFVQYAAPELQGDGSEFGKPARSKLVAHSDDSEVTLNVCLGREYTGGELVVYGRRGTNMESTPLCTIQPRLPGRALLHSGRTLHEVLPVERGQRFGLILWTRSLRGVRDGVCPCCWMNGRHPFPSHCICGPAWN